MTAPDTTTTPPPSNAPAPPRSFGLIARRLRHWLGIADQRHDFNALGATLSVKDQATSANGQELTRLAGLLEQVIPQLNHVTSGVLNLTDRLAWHEQRLPSLGNSRKAYEMALKRERARREQLIEQHPEWNTAQQQYVRGTGKLPPVSVAQEEAKP